MGEDGTDDEGVVDEGDDPASTAAIGALEDVGAEGALHKFCPQQPAAQRSVGVGPRVAAGGGGEGRCWADELAMEPSSRGKDAMIANQICPRRWDERGQACDEVELRQQGCRPSSWGGGTWMQGTCRVGRFRCGSATKLRCGGERDAEETIRSRVACSVGAGRPLRFWWRGRRRVRGAPAAAYVGAARRPPGGIPCSGMENSSRL